MTDKDVKAPNPAIVEKATEKAASGDDLSQREAAALAAQAKIDADRGYCYEEWRPGVYHYRSLASHDTAFTETEIIRKVNEERVNARHAANQ